MHRGVEEYSAVPETRRRRYMERIPPRERVQVVERARGEAYGAAVASGGMIAFLVALALFFVVAAPH
jgi:hypothetical protein